MHISFHGAAEHHDTGGVTGSAHLLHVGEQRILVDCGLFQGPPPAEARNHQGFGFKAEDVDAMVLTHAHLDHCGRLPLLVKRGFTGPIYMTDATRELASLVLRDSARIQEADSARAAKYGREEPPLYTSEDVEACIARFDNIVSYGEKVRIGHGVFATWHDAGHILGSSSIRFELTDGKHRCTVLFSGDIGSDGRPLVRDPEPPPGNDVVVMESTYGDRRHKDLDASVKELIEAIKSTLGRGGNVLIPAFALERTQDILYFLHEAIRQGELPQDLPVYLDSPMAISATEIFRRHPECLDEEALACFADGCDPMALPNLQFTRLTEESKAINDHLGSAVIIAGSGMCNGGRILHHLRRDLGKAETSVIFVGFAVEGTLARRIIDGAKEIRLFGEYVPVEARIYTIGGFSAHADQAELVAWHQAAGSPRRTYLVHGETGPKKVLARLLPGEVMVPRTNKRYPLV